MKKLSTLSLALCTAATAMAQTQRIPGTNFLKPNAHQQHIARMLQLQDLPGAQKTTAIMERVIAESYYEGAALIDSITYRYPAGHPSRFNYLLMAYSTDYNPTGPSISYLIFDPKPAMLHDTMTYMSTSGGGGLQVVQTEGHTYDGSFNRLTQRTQLYNGGNITSGDRFVNTYINGNKTESLYLRWNAGTSQWDTMGTKYSMFNAQNLVVKDSIVDVSGGTPVSGGNYEYTYVLGDKVSTMTVMIDGGGSWQPIQQFNFGYYPNGLLKTAQMEYDMGSGMTPLVRDTFGYAGPKNRNVLWEEYQYDMNTSQWVGTVKLEKHLDVAGNPDTMIVYADDFGTWVPGVMYHFNYNSFENPVLGEEYVYTGGSPSSTPNSISHYYYEQYNNTSVKNVASKQADIIAFPNPATNTLNLSWKDANAGERVTIQLLNAVGQLVHSESLNWMQATEQINIGNLPVGNYRLLVSDRGGAVIHQHAVVKQ